jgi:DNA-binding NarL/FixJ family response regulator
MPEAKRTSPKASLRVLLVEDDEVDRLRVHRAVRKTSAPLEIVDADSVASGCRALESDKFDCAIIDFHLPDGTALDLMAFNAARVDPLPIVVLTGADDEGRAL